jgi:hypothetical protein
MKKAQGRPGYMVTVATELETRCLCSLHESFVILAIAIGINACSGQYMHPCSPSSGPLP